MRVVTMKPIIKYLITFSTLLTAIPGTASQTFDYIIVGAGTSGLVVANRLSEDPSVTVAVIEPGNDESTNPLVTNPDNFINTFDTYLDWNYTTVPQSGANGLTIPMRTARAWGGTSAINGRPRMFIQDESY